jgi:hypothetical protein
VHAPETAVHREGVAIALPARTWTFVAGVISLLAIGGLSTQALSIATGRDFVFGLVPRLDPSGTRNLPVWLATAALALSAGAVASAAAAVRARRGTAWQWWSLAGLLLVLSSHRMAGYLHGLLPVLPGSARQPWLEIVATGAVALALCLRQMSTRARHRALIASAVFLVGLLTCATAARPDFSAALSVRLSHAVLMTSGRTLEVAGLALFVAAVVGYSGSPCRTVLLVVDSAALSGRLEPVPNGVVVRFSPARLHRCLAWLVALVVTASLAAVAARRSLGPDVDAIYRTLNVDFEGNIPTWFSTLLLLACGVLGGIVAAARQQSGDALWQHWAALSALFIGLSADEAASFHELLVEPLRSAFRGNRWLWFPLVVPGSVAAAIVCVAFQRFVRTLPSETRRACVAGALLYLAGVLVLETMGGWFDPVRYGESWIYVVLSTLEEGLEMGGIVVILVGWLRYVERVVGPVRLDGLAP